MAPMSGEQLTHTPRLHNAMDEAARIAREAGHDQLGAEHVFLAIIQDADSVPAQVLRRLGLHPQAISEALAETMDSSAYRKSDEQ